MARVVNPLTNTQVKQAKPKDKLYKLSDGGAPNTGSFRTIKDP